MPVLIHRDHRFRFRGVRAPEVNLMQPSTALRQQPSSNVLAHRFAFIAFFHWLNVCCPLVLPLWALYWSLQSNMGSNRGFAASIIGVILATQCWLGYRVVAHYYRLRSGAQAYRSFLPSQSDRRGMCLIMSIVTVAGIAISFAETQMLLMVGPMVIGALGLCWMMLTEPATAG